MTTPPPRRSSEQKSPLVAEVQRILGDARVARMRYSPAPAAWGPLAGALGVLAGYALLWLTVEAVAGYYGWQRQPRLIGLLAWGGLYFTAGYFFVQSAAARFVGTIEHDIQPHASRAYLRRVTGELRDRHGRKLSQGLPLIVALASLAAATLAVDADVEGGKLTHALLTSPEFLFWGVTYFIYFFTAAQGVVAARFYLSFANHLKMETKSFYVMGAAESPLVVGLAKLSSQVLLFWLTIFLAIVSSMLLAAPWLRPYALPLDSKFLLILVPIAGFFSLGFGSIVYLGAEAKIRATLRRFTHEKLAQVRKRSNELFPDRAADSSQDRETLSGLADLHDRVVAGGRYGSRMGAALSLALPLILPIVSLVKLVVGF